MNTELMKAVVLDKFYDAEYPEHSRTSCSDEHPVNADVTGHGCLRCNAIFFTQASNAFQALRDLEAEIERLRDISDGNAELYQHEALRAEKADSLLRETLRYLDPRHYSEIIKRITAHLGGDHE